MCGLPNEMVNNPGSVLSAVGQFISNTPCSCSHFLKAPYVPVIQRGAWESYFLDYNSPNPSSCERFWELLVNEIKFWPLLARYGSYIAKPFPISPSNHSSLHPPLSFQMFRFLNQSKQCLLCLFIPLHSRACAIWFRSGQFGSGFGIWLKPMHGSSKKAEPTCKQ